MSSLQDILSNPTQWPSTFPQPTAGTRVITYIFDKDKDPSEFISFVEKNFPKALLKVSKDQKGFSSVSITQHFPGVDDPSAPSATADEYEAPYGDATADNEAVENNEEDEEEEEEEEEEEAEEEDDDDDAPPPLPPPPPADSSPPMVVEAPDGDATADNEAVENP